MKKIIFVLLAFIGIIVLGLAIFLWTFDVDRYRPQLVKQMGAALGSPIKLGKLSLAWQEGLALELTDLSIYQDQNTMDKPAIYLERAAASIHLASLLRKQVEIVSVVLVRPRLNVIREADGSLAVHGIHPKLSSPKPAAKDAGKSSFQSSAFLIKSVKIIDAGVGFVDKTSHPSVQLAVRKLDVSIKNLSFEKPVDLQAKMALFNPSQNIQLKGRIRISGALGPYSVENFRADMNLDSVDMKELQKSLPQIQKAGLESPLLGKAVAEIKKLKISSGGIAELESVFNLRNGQITVESLRSPFAELHTDAIFTKNELTLKDVQASFARGQITASGTSKDYLSKSPDSNLHIQISKVFLEDLLPKARSGKPEIHGKFSADFQGHARGLSWPAISQTLNGDGQVSLDEGVIVNGNILRIVFEKLSQIPGVSEALNSRIPPAYQQKLSRPDTIIPPIRFPVKVANGILLIPHLRIMGDGYEIFGVGQVGLSGPVSCEVTLVMDAVLSQALLESVPQMQYITGPDGRLALPVRILGTTQNLRIEPDMDYVFSRVMATKGQELITNVLQKALNKNQPQAAAGESASSAASQDPSYQQIIGSLFQ